MKAEQNLGREIARQFLTRKFGDDRHFLALGDEAFAYVHGRAIVTIGFDEISDDIKTEARFVIEHESRVA